MLRKRDMGFANCVVKNLQTGLRSRAEICPTLPQEVPKHSKTPINENISKLKSNRIFSSCGAGAITIAGFKTAGNPTHMLNEMKDRILEMSL